MKKIVLHSSSFVWINNGEGLIYNVENNKHLVFSLDDPGIREACDCFLDIDNLYSAKYDEKTASARFTSFLDEVQRLELGVIVDDVNAPIVSIPPVLKVKHGVENLHFWRGDLTTSPVLPYLFHLRVFLGGKCEDNSKWIQGPYPMSSEKKLEAERLLSYMSSGDERFFTGIDLVVSEWDPRQISSFVEGLKDRKDDVRFFFANSDPGFNNEILNGLTAEGFAITQVCPPDARLEKVSWVSGRNYQLLVKSDAEAEYWESLLQDAEDVNYDFKPIADNNLEFFRENVFLSEEEILSQKLSKKDIFRHQALNANQFGTFYVFPDGTIHSATDAPAVGTLEDSVHQTIIRELEQNYAWRQTRRLMEPCKNCLYHDLCPSPSVYERIFGVPGCTYWQE